MTFSSAPLPRANQAPPKKDRDWPALKAMLEEARQMVTDKEVTKSNASSALLRLHIRTLEAMLYGAPVTPIPSKISHPEDLEERPQPSPPRRL
jgi:hypothetical protein